MPGGDFTMSTTTRVIVDDDAGTFAASSQRNPNAIYARSCDSRAQVRMSTPTVPIGSRDGGRD